MNRPEDRLEAQIDRAAEALRRERMSDAEIDAAATRIRERLAEAGGLASPVLDGCEAFLALVPQALAGTLPEPRRQLLEDHARSCPRCRAAWNRARDGRPAGAEVVALGTRTRPGRRARWMRWGLAAALVLGALLVLPLLRGALAPAPGAAVLEVADGALFAAAAAGDAALAAGDHVPYGEQIRTPRGVGAVVRLADGSRIELRERSAVALAHRGGDTVIQLARGNIIVEAAPQGSGHLFVSTPDCEVAVTGTVFAVNRGTKGSRVSVLEGEVHVEHGREQVVLHAGGQVTTHPSLAPAPVEDEVAWSRDLERLRPLLDEVKALRAQLAAIPAPPARSSTRLLDLMPAGTVMYGSAPNVSGTLDEAQRIFEGRLATSAELKQWWEANAGPEAEKDLALVRDKLRLFGAEIGDEIAVGVVLRSAKESLAVLALTTLTHAETFPALLEREIAQARESAGGEVPLRVVTTPRDLAPGEGDAPREALTFWVAGDVLAASTDERLLAELASRVAAGAPSPLAASPFAGRLRAAYGEGAEWLFGVDVHAMLDAAAGQQRGKLDQLGLLAARDLIVERKSSATGPVHQATLGFDGPRRGIASWLAEPGPMGALSFISPDATTAAGIVFKDPSAVFADLLAFSAADAQGLREALDAARRELAVDVEHDLVGNLGGEAAFAIDGPLLPTPAWKVIVEVYDPAPLQRALETLVGAASAKLVAEGRPALVVARDDAGPAPTYSVCAGDQAFCVHYTYADGYLVAAQDRALLARTLAGRAAGQVLTSSSAFRDLLPRDGRVNFSAILYQGLGRITAPIAALVPQGGTSQSPGKAAGLSAMLALTGGPSLAYAYAEPERITMVSTGDDPLGNGLGLLFGAGGLRGLTHPGLAPGGAPPGDGAP
ncbi:MAG: FecR domain-containing protein [Acidobacteria bacterium]|nr:FecR domain-containing protein [Acidobacteriota bacterium]